MSPVPDAFDYDVLIVGAGVAGCAAAVCLPPGTRALLIDRGRPRTERCCGGLLSSDAQKALDSLGLALPPDVRVEPEPHTVTVRDRDSGLTQTYRRDYVNVHRGRFDAWLLGLANERVRVRMQTRFAGLTHGGVVLRSETGAEVVPTRMVIGADGATSTVRSDRFPRHPGPPLMIALQARFACDHPPDSHVVLFDSTLTDFYAWAIPKAGSVLIGCAFRDRRDARERFEKVIDWYRAELGLWGDPAERAARYLSQPTSRSHLSAGDGSVLLAGEAAGLVSPSSGEGISFALLSGAAAGRAAAAPGRAGPGARPGDAYAPEFGRLARKVLRKTVKARVIHSPTARRWALRLPWCP